METIGTFSRHFQHTHSIQSHAQTDRTCAGKLTIFARSSFGDTPMSNWYDKSSNSFSKLLPWQPQKQQKSSSNSSNNKSLIRDMSFAGNHQYSSVTFLWSKTCSHKKWRRERHGSQVVCSANGSGWKQQRHTLSKGNISQTPPLSSTATTYTGYRLHLCTLNDSIKCFRRSQGNNMRFRKPSAAVNLNFCPYLLFSLSLSITISQQQEQQQQ